MAMDFKHKSPYQRKLYILLLTFSWTMAACFLAFQYNREREYKALQLDTQLQGYNSRIIAALQDGVVVDSATKFVEPPVEDVRVTVINPDGLMTFDNKLDTLSATSHLTRSEIAAALKTGKGYAIRRHSETTNTNYFYSATLAPDGTIVRSAVPYSLSLGEVLAADRKYLWSMLGITLLFSILAWFVVKPISSMVSRLSDFAGKAERGERIYDADAFSKDELGEISGNIIRLYARLQNTIAERDSHHEMAMREQQEKQRIKRELTNNLNHELKTPVAAINLCFETLLAHPDLEEGQRKDFLSRGHEHVHRLQHLLADVSAITRLEEGSEKIEKEPVDIALLVDDVIFDAQQQAKEKGVQVTAEIPAGTVVNGSYQMLESIFHNLVENACVYSGGTQVVIKLESGFDRDLLLFSVEDDGEGVAEKHLSRLFERFYRVDKGRSRRAGGTGLGLAIVKHAVNFHGGQVKATIGSQGGLRLLFTLAK